MAKLIEYPTKDGSVLIAVTRGGADVTPVANLEDTIQKAAQNLRDSFQIIRRIADDFVASLQAGVSAVTSAELEFGLDLTGKGTIYVVETTAQASFKVKLVLDLKK